MKIGGDYMADYIKKEDAIRIAENNMSRFYIAARIGDCPAADVAPVRHGRWFKNDPHCDGLAFLWNCSECGAESDEGYLYCPNCGAKMDKGE